MERNIYWIVKDKGYKKIHNLKQKVNELKTHNNSSLHDCKSARVDLLIDVLDDINDLIVFNQYETSNGGDIVLHVNECIENILPPLIKNN